MPKQSLPRFLGRGFRGYALRFIKSAVKIAIGRPPYFYDQDRFFLVYLRQLLGLSKARVTCRLDDCPTEGGGSQAITMMIAIDFARSLGIAYVHTPFVEIQHADRPREAWLAAWEGLFNLGAGEVARSLRSTGGSDRSVFAITAVNLDLIRALFCELIPCDGNDTHVMPQFSAAIVAEFRRKYYSNKSPRRNAKLTVCVHIRRFNAFDNNIDYVASLPRVGRTLARVRSILEENGIEHAVRIFSQGPAAEFPDALRRGAELHLDADPIRTLEELVEADVLITSRGSFSYVAGLLCDGIVIGEPFYPPQYGWLVCDGEGEIDIDAFARRLPANP
jgi:hypothetical protein